jgi:hypothetical protein
MRWNWRNKPRYKGQWRPSDDGRFPADGLAIGIRQDLTAACRPAEGDPERTYANRGTIAVL